MTVPARVHHSAITARDVEASVRFYRDGIGLTLLMDRRFDGDWPTLFGVRSTSLRSVFLGDPAAPDAGVVELVDFGEAPAPAPPGSAGGAGFLLLSFFVDLDATLARLAALGHDDVRRIAQPAPGGAVAMATVRDPDGVLVELIDTAAVGDG
ncbi:MAG TPA: VOC family protein [Acidimicrobiales bacterium]|nr:VOC family protein [Acidimicrobiales bacterium]